MTISFCIFQEIRSWSFLIPNWNWRIINSGSFEFDIPAVNPMCDKMKKLTSVIRVEKDGDSIFYGRIFSMEKNFYNTQTVVCEGELAYLLDSIQEPKAYHSYTVRSFLNALLAVHNMQTTMEKRLGCHI